MTQKMKKTKTKVNTWGNCDELLKALSGCLPGLATKPDIHRDYSHTGQTQGRTDVKHLNNMIVIPLVRQV